MYTNILSASKDTLTSYLPACITLSSLRYLIALAQTSNTVLSRYGKSEQPCLVPDVSGNVSSLSSFRLNLAINCLYYFDVFPCNPNLLRNFIMKGVLEFVKVLFFI